MIPSAFQASFRAYGSEAFEVDRDNAPALEDANTDGARQKEVAMPPMWENLDGLPWAPQGLPSRCLASGR